MYVVDEVRDSHDPIVIELRYQSGHVMNRSAVITVDPLVALGEETVEQDHSHGAFSAVIRTASPKLTLLNGTSVKFVACAEALDPVYSCSRDLAIGRRSYEPIENVDRDSH